MTIYISNSTRQHWTHFYRQPESAKMHVVNIPSGGQVEIGKGWNTLQTQYVVDHLETFGARQSHQVNGKIEDFTGLLYRVDKVVTENQIIAGHDAVIDNIEKRSASEATKAALGFDAAFRDRKSGGKRGAKMTGVTVKQDIDKRQKPTGAEVSFDLEVSEDGHSDVKLPI
jgi:hypothetical protein